MSNKKQAKKKNCPVLLKYFSMPEKYYGRLSSKISWENLNLKYIFGRPRYRPDPSSERTLLARRTRCSPRRPKQL